MINPFEMVVLIVAIVMIASIYKSKHRSGRHPEVAEEERGESVRLKQEVADLKDRIKVLERIAVEKEDTLSREIDRLRDR